MPIQATQSCHIQVMGFTLQYMSEIVSHKLSRVETWSHTPSRNEMVSHVLSRAEIIHASTFKC